MSENPVSEEWAAEVVAARKELSTRAEAWADAKEVLAGARKAYDGAVCDLTNVIDSREQKRLPLST